MIYHYCTCGKKLKLWDSLVGKEGNCLYCKNRFTLREFRPSNALPIPCPFCGKSIHRLSTHCIFCKVALETQEK